MASLANWLSISGVIIQTGVLFWAARGVFYTFGKYYDETIMKSSVIRDQFKDMKKQQVPILIALLMATVLQVIGLLMQ